MNRSHDERVIMYVGYIHRVHLVDTTNQFLAKIDPWGLFSAYTCLCQILWRVFLIRPKKRYIFFRKFFFKVALSNAIYNFKYLR